MSVGLVLLGLAMLYLYYDNKKNGNKSIISKLKQKADDTL